MISFVLKMTAHLNKAKGKAKAKQLEVYKKLEEHEKLKAFKKGDIKTELDELGTEKGKEAKKLEKEVKDNKLKTMLLLTLSYIIGFFESLPIYITIFLSVLALVVIIGVIVMVITMIVALQSLLSGEKDKVPQIQAPVTEQGQAGAGGSAEWSLEELAQRGGLLTNHEKNLYKLIMLSKNGLTGVYDGKPVIYPTGGDLEMPLRFATGIFSTENSGVIYLKGGDKKDILVTPTDDTEINSSGYGSLFGIEASKNLNAYFDSASADKIRNMFKPDTSGNEIFFIPYGSAMSVKHFNVKLDYGLTLIKNNNQETPARDVIKSFGIVAGAEDVYRFAMYVFATSLYHGGNVYDFPDITAFVSALYASTSDNDAERSFDKVKYLGGTNYDESTFRKAVLGSTGYKDIGKYSTPVDLPKANISAYFNIGGVDVKEPLWKFLYQKFSSNANMVEAWKVARAYANANDATSARVLNFHYGINSYYQGGRIIDDISGKLTGTPAGNTNVVAGDFKETPGKGQGNWGGKTAEEIVADYVSKSGMKSYMEGLVKTFGTAKHIKQGEKVDGVVWQTAKFATPFYGQGNRFGETYNNLKWYPNAETYGYSGCMVYAHAYAASCMTGLLINPPEMGAIMIAKGALSGAGIHSGEMGKVYSLLGLQSKILPDFNGSNWTSNWSQVDSCLDKGGVAVVRATGSPYASGPNHFLVITGKTVDSSGKKMYSMYTSTSVPQTNSLHSEATLKANLHRGVVLVWK